MCDLIRDLSFGGEGGREDTILHFLLFFGGNGGKKNFLKIFVSFHLFFPVFKITPRS